MSGQKVTQGHEVVAVLTTQEQHGTKRMGATVAKVADHLGIPVWPAEQVKQIRQTLAHINITEKYRKDSKSGFEQQPKEESERPKVWRERSSGELKTYLSQRGVDMMEVDSERYLREIMGDPDFSVKPLNRLSKATTINVQQNSTQNIVSETSDELNTNKLRDSASEVVSIISFVQKHRASIRPYSNLESS